MVTVITRVTVGVAEQCGDPGRIPSERAATYHRSELIGGTEQLDQVPGGRGIDHHLVPPLPPDLLGDLADGQDLPHGRGGGGHVLEDASHRPEDPGRDGGMEVEPHVLVEGGLGVEHESGDGGLCLCLCPCLRPDPGLGQLLHLPRNEGPTGAQGPGQTPTSGGVDGQHRVTGPGSLLGQTCRHRGPPHAALAGDDGEPGRTHGDRGRSGAEADAALGIAGR